MERAAEKQAQLKWFYHGDLAVRCRHSLRSKIYVHSVCSPCFAATLPPVCLPVAAEIHCPARKFVYLASFLPSWAVERNPSCPLPSLLLPEGSRWPADQLCPSVGPMNSLPWLYEDAALSVSLLLLLCVCQVIVAKGPGQASPSLLLGAREN